MSEILEYLTDNHEKMLLDLEEFVTRETPTMNKSRTDDFAEFLADYARELGGEVEILPATERGNHVRVSWNGKNDEKPILLLGHFDTVWPVGTLKRIPFRVEDGIGRAPGIFDMKGGLVQGFWAVRALREVASLDRNIVFFCNSDEETHSTTSRPLVEKEAKEASVALVLESSTDGKLTTARKGVGWFDVRIMGREAHAGVNPFDGVSAIDELAHVILELHGYTNPDTGTTVNVGVVEGGTAGNVVAGKAWANVNLRAVNEQEAQRMETEILGLKAHNEGAVVEISGSMKRPPMERGQSTARLLEHARKLGGEMGFELEEHMSGGGSDGNFCAALGTPTLDGLGAVGKGAHAESEHILVGKMPERAALVARLIQTL